MHTYQTITDHKRPTDHYRHISQLLTSMRRRALERCDMSPRPRIASMSVASAVAIGLCVADRRRATSDRRALHRCGRRGPTSCRSRRRGRDSGLALVVQSPTDRATACATRMSARRYPSWVSCPKAFLNALSPRSAPVQQQAAVAPAPNPPGTGTQPPPTAAQPVPDAAAAQPPPAPAPPRRLGHRSSAG